MATIVDTARTLRSLEESVLPSAVLVRACDGYAAGTTGTVVGARQGCFEFKPDRPDHIARWAVPRATLLVPTSFVVTD